MKKKIIILFVLISIFAIINTVNAVDNTSEIINTSDDSVNTIKDVKLMAYDTNGKSLDVEIVPATISATLAVQSPEKKVPLKVIPEGISPSTIFLETGIIRVSSIILFIFLTPNCSS